MPREPAYANKRSKDCVAQFASERAEGTMPILFGTGFAHQKVGNPGRLRRVAR